MSAVVWKNLSLLRGIAMCLVVLNHATKSAYGLRPVEFVGPFSVEFPLSSLLFVLLLNISPLCLPAFLVASGLFAFRWLRSWRSCLTNVKQLLRRYLLWAIPIYLLLIAVTAMTFDPWKMGAGLLKGGPLASYWFFALLIKLYLISPLLIRGIDRWPRAVGAAALALQITVCLRYYLYLSGNSILFPIIPEHGVLLHLPFYMLGMYMSRNLTAVVDFITRHRGKIALSTLLALLAACAESSLIGLAELWRTPRHPNFFAGERATEALFGLLAPCLIISARASASPLRRWLDGFGMASLGILLTTDLCMRLMFALMWHVPQCLGDISMIPTASGLAPAWMSALSVGLGFILSAAGVFGPLFIMYAIQRLAGGKVYAFLFGAGTTRRPQTPHPTINPAVA